MAKSGSILMLALSLALFVSCNGKSGNKSETTETITEAPVEQATETEMPVEEEDEYVMPMEQAPTYYNLVGKVAGSDVHMSLELDHNKVMGRYYYDSQSKKATPASMKFFGVSHGAYMEFTEFYSDKPTGTFDGYWTDESFQGTFTRAKDGKTFDFSLTSVYAAIEPGGGEAFFQDFDDFYFDIPFYNEYNPSQGQTVMQPQPSEEQQRVQEEQRRQQEEQYRANIINNAIYFPDMIDDFKNPIKAEKKYSAGMEIILKVYVDKIRNYSSSGYKYLITDDRLYEKARIYTNDENFAEIDYPCYVWIHARFNDRESYWDEVIYSFTDAQLLLSKKSSW